MTPWVPSLVPHTYTQKDVCSLYANTTPQQLFRDKVLLGCPSWPRSHDPPASNFQVAGLQVCTQYYTRDLSIYGIWYPQEVLKLIPQGKFTDKTQTLS